MYVKLIKKISINIDNEILIGKREYHFYLQESRFEQYFDLLMDY